MKVEVVENALAQATAPMVISKIFIPAATASIGDISFEPSLVFTHEIDPFEPMDVSFSEIHEFPPEGAVVESAFVAS